ncbi:hypothetical protein K4A83_17960 [Spirulina subsalsa FACHB-351]|uniref:Uncharacterized protein n=1 Tax=Spirulina subsalsa FACHB-351 TaxID=234711 RepID=A0ABT3L9F6_9CYAN|nr:hypothetical protein [Spirulina subsalsa]MCW6038141.1 hypothetical protein [Spirulina subsalsa FACHB-351]
MNTLNFLAELNDAEKGWGLWVDKDHVNQFHVGQYAFENDRLPKSFIHVGSLDSLAHKRQYYILHNNSLDKNEDVLSQEWAEDVLSHLDLS